LVCNRECFGRLDLAATRRLPVLRRLDVLRPTTQAGRIPREICGPVGTDHVIAVPTEYHRDGGSCAQLRRNAPDHAELEPMQHVRRWLNPKLPVENEPTLPRSVDNLVCVDPPRSCRAVAFDPEHVLFLRDRANRV